MSNIVSIVLLIASIGLFFGYIDPTYSDVKGMFAEKSELDNALAHSKDLQKERDALLVKYNLMPKADREMLTKLVPDGIDNVRLIIDLDEMAKKYGMRIRNFRADTAEKSDTLGKSSDANGTLTLSFSTTASYNTFLSFLKDLEHSLRIIDINAVTFSSSDTNTLYDYNVTVKTYWLK